MTTFRRGLLVLLLCCAALLLSSPASAQYFGRNKVQYRTFDFEVMKTEHFDIYFYPEEKGGVDIAARMAERWYSRLRRLLRHELRGRQPLILYASHVDFEQTNVIGGEIGEGTGGVTEPIARRIVLPLAGPLAETDHVIGHELVHAFQFDMTTLTDAPAGMTGLQPAPAVVRRRDGRVPLDRPARSQHRDVVARRRAPGAAARDQGSRRPRVLSVSLGSGVLGLRRRPVRRSGDAAAPHPGRGHPLRPGDRTGPRRERRSVVERLARRDSEERGAGAAGDRTRARGSAADRPGPRVQGRAQRGSGAQPRRALAGVPVQPVAALDRRLHRRRDERTHRPQADQHGHQPPLLQHPVHPLGGCVGSRQPAARRRHRGLGPAGAGDLRRADRGSRSRDPHHGGGRDPGAGVGARRQRDRLQRSCAAA